MLTTIEKIRRSHTYQGLQRLPNRKSIINWLKLNGCEVYTYYGVILQLNKEQLVEGMYCSVYYNGQERLTAHTSESDFTTKISQLALKIDKERKVLN